MAEQLNNLLWKKCLVGSVEEVRQALCAGADPNAARGNTNTCLMVATTMNHDRVVELLLSNPGIQVNAKNVENHTALHLACIDGYASLAMILSSSGVQLNEKDYEGNTPIMLAIWFHWSHSGYSSWSKGRTR